MLGSRSVWSAAALCRFGARQLRWEFSKKRRVTVRDELPQPKIGLEARAAVRRSRSSVPLQISTQQGGLNQVLTANRHFIREPTNHTESFGGITHI